LVRWNQAKVVFSDKIKVWVFAVDEDTPPYFIGIEEEEEVNGLVTDAIIEWNSNYSIQFELDDASETGVNLAFLSDESFFFVTGSETYAAGRAIIPATWNQIEEQYETSEHYLSNETLTEKHRMAAMFFSLSENSPSWTASTSPTQNGESLLGTVILHELGHLLLMGHTSGTEVDIHGDPVPRIMDAGYDPTIIVPTLTQGDIINAAFHYQNLYIGPSLQGSITFSPPPNIYHSTVTIEMTNNSSTQFPNTEIWFNWNLNTDLNTAKAETPDLSTDNMQVYYPGSFNDHKVFPSPYWYYFKARLFNTTIQMFVGQQTEGAYKVETNGCSKTILSIMKLNANKNIIDLLFDGQGVNNEK
jgi:hypothetical protein